MRLYSFHSHTHRFFVFQFQFQFQFISNFRSHHNIINNSIKPVLIYATIFVLIKKNNFYQELLCFLRCSSYVYNQWNQIEKENSATELARRDLTTHTHTHTHQTHQEY